jgi:hypothetical protein
MIEYFHDNNPPSEPRLYFIDSDLLQKDNPIDVMIMKKLDKKAFTQKIYVLADEYEESDPEFWDDPGKAIKKGDLIPEKT